MGANIIVITVLGSAAVFALSLVILGSGSQGRQQVGKRVTELSGEQDSRAARKKPGKRHTAQQSTLARTKKKLATLEDQLYDVGVHISVRRFLLLWGAAAYGIPLIAALAGASLVLSLGLAVFIALAPILYLRQKRSKRKSALEEQLVDAIGVMINALRAGHSFQTAMNSIAEEMTGPVAEEFGRVFRETQHGMTMQESMGRMIDRTGSDDLEMLCTAILIQREVGGNLAEVLENISGTIRARLSLKTEVKTRTASGRLSGYLVGALPVVLLAVISAINPEYSDSLFHTELGRIMLGVGAGMEIIGFMVILKIVSIKY